MNAAEIHNNRYKALAPKAEGAFLKLSALDAWAREKDWPVSFARVFRYQGEGEPPPQHRYFIESVLLGLKIADTFIAVADDQAIAHYARSIGASAADRRAAHAGMMLEVDYRILCAVFDGELMLYDSAGFTIEVAGERLRYEESPETFGPLDFPLSKTLEPSMSPRSKQRKQENVILAHLRQEGWNPGALPKNRSGKPGVKMAVRLALLQHRALFRSLKTFNLAWERLRQSGQIADQTQTAAALPQFKG